MEDIIKIELLHLMEELNGWKGSFESDGFYDEGHPDYGKNDPFATYKANGIGSFIKKCSLLSKNNELLDLAETIVKKANELEEQEEKRWQQYEESRSKDYWAMKP